MFASPKLILALVASLAVISDVGAAANQKADTKWFFPGFWIPLNIPTPAPAAAAAATTCDPAVCCKSFCTGGTAPVTCMGTPQMCSSGTLSTTKCFLASAGATCTAALCTTCATACPAATVTTDATCPM